MLRLVLGMMFVFVSAFSFAKTKSDSTVSQKCADSEYYSYGEEQCLTITSNIKMRARCPKGTKAIGTGFDAHGKRALACAKQDEAQQEASDRDLEEHHGDANSEPHTTD